MKQQIEKIQALLLRHQIAAAEYELEVLAKMHEDQHFPTQEMIERGVKFALSASVHGEGGWPKYIEQLYMAMNGKSIDLK